MEKPTNHSLKISDTLILYYPTEQIGDFWIFRLNKHIGIRYNLQSNLIDFYSYHSDEQVKFYEGTVVGNMRISDKSYVNLICNMYKEGYDCFRSFARSFILKRGIFSIIIINIILFIIIRSIPAFIGGHIFGIGYLIYKSLTFVPSASNCQSIANTIKEFYNDPQEKEVSESPRDKT